MLNEEDHKRLQKIQSRVIPDPWIALQLSWLVNKVHKLHDESVKLHSENFAYQTTVENLLEEVEDLRVKYDQATGRA